MIIEVVVPKTGQVAAVVITSQPTVSANFLVKLADDYTKGRLASVNFLHGRN